MAISPKVALVLAMACCGAAAAAPTGTRVGVGMDYSRGTYGSTLGTGIFSVPFSLERRSERWRFRASLPWLHVDGDPNVLPTLGLVDNLNPLGRGRLGTLLGTAPAEPERGSASGLGDLTLEAAYRLPTRGKLGLEVGLQAKIATADEDRGLGTGANDYGASLELHRQFGGTLVFAGVGHTVVGKTAFLDLDDVSSGRVGASRQLGRSTVGASYQHRSAAHSGVEARRDLVGFLELPGSSSRRVQLYASRGLSDSSPDWGLGVNVSLGD